MRSGIRKYPIDVGISPLFGGRAPTMSRTSCIALPYSEATADASTFVCEFLGGAGANETGVGLGLTGADLVLTQVGSVPASSGGYRALDGVSMYFTGTATFAAAFLNQSEWTYALKVKSLTITSGKFLCNFFDGTATQALCGIGDAGGTFNGRIGLQTHTIANSTVLNNSATPWWVCMWLKGGVYHLGWVQQEAIPTGWNSFPAGQRASRGGGTSLSVTWSTIQAVGSSAAPPAVSVGVLVCSKIGLAAAPV